ncbi:unnamed protein product [Candidula unifasciata]|uniref:Small ribosomal subunit protein mS31 n=1 Tax=Candidula unifasciata TaxID=100452 RepID=A0A8S3ZC05_9EUPU|nr:unnamed protein product [Candidula unifasciata]
MDAEQLRKALGAVPRNAFEEMIQWTKEGKLWKFPIDNEADMDEERKYKFHEHIFLERHLSDFPKKGPVRKFMELVALGLSRNPWISVPEKIEHIRWYADYFRQKQDILVESIGEEGRMKKPDEQIE